MRMRTTTPTRLLDRISSGMTDRMIDSLSFDLSCRMQSESCCIVSRVGREALLRRIPSSPLRRSPLGNSQGISRRTNRR
jgi:hypothetical protein